jgi:cell wall-associated NlpC family hydrolase
MYFKLAEMKSIVSHLRQWLLKKLEKPRKGYEQRVYNDFEKLYNIIRPGDVVLVEGRSEMSRIIKLFSGSSWSHAAMYVGNALIDSSHDHGNRYVALYGNDANHMLIEAYSGQGVIAAPLSKYQVQHYRND